MVQDTENKKTLLVTGGAGFIGSNFIRYILQEDPTITVVNVDRLTYAGSMDNLKDLKNQSRHIFTQGDICDQPFIENLFQQHSFTGVIHFAAESHVDNSIVSPEEFVRTNIQGTFCLLDTARHQWMKEPFSFRSHCASNRFLHISTDEVFGSLSDKGYFTESSPYAPNSPYSASKASADMLVRSYYRTYGMNVVTTYSSNNYGPSQHVEKLIPTVIRTALTGKPIPLYGDGMHVRDWLYVVDHCKGIKVVFDRGHAGETYAMGGHNEKTNYELVHTICDFLDLMRPKKDGTSYKNQIVHVKDRAGHDRRYAINSSKVKTELNWTPDTEFEEGLRSTVAWFCSTIY